jgi:chemotaxis regulatin CheY-phosphate phosphatase CheZ
MSPTGSLAIMRAFDKLKGSLSSQDKKEFLNTTLADVRLAALAIETEQAARKSIRNVRRIKPFLDTMESYSKIIEVLCQGYPPMSFVWVGTAILAGPWTDDIRGL